MRYRFGMMPALLAATAHRALRMAEAGEEGAPAAPVEGVTTDGATTRFTPPTAETGQQAPAKEEAPARPAEWPEGVNSWEDFGKLSPEDRTRALAPKTDAAAETTVETKGKEGEAPKEGLDLLVEQQTAGMAPETAAVVGPMVREFAEKGDLTPAQVKETATKLGLSEALVQQYVDNAKLAGSVATAEAVAPFHALTGGAENYAGFQAWANEALGPEDHAKINAAVDAGKAADIASYVDTWKASGRAPAPRDLTTEAQGDTTSQAADVYESRAQMTKDMNSAKYRNDPAFRAAVEAKVGRSNV